MIELFNWRRFSLLAVIYFSLFSSACSTHKVYNSESLLERAKAQALSSQESNETLIKNAASLIEEAEKSEASQLARLHLEKARTALDKARELNRADSEDDLRDARTNASLAALYAEQATSAANIVQGNLKPVLANLEILKELQADLLFPEDFNAIQTSVEQLKTLTEAGNYQDAITEQDKVLDEISRLEVSVLTKRYLGEAKAMLDSLDENGTNEYVANHYEQAQSTFYQTLLFIKDNFRNHAAIKRKATETNNMVAETFYMAQDIEKLKLLDPEQTETHIATLYQKARAASKAIGAPDADTASSLQSKLESINSYGMQTSNNQTENNNELRLSRIKIEQLESDILELQQQVAELRAESVAPTLPPLFTSQRDDDGLSHQSTRDQGEILEMKDEPF